MNDERSSASAPPPDALSERYREAAGLDGATRPSEGRRAAILAQAEAQAVLHASEGPGRVGDPARGAANEGRWRLKAFASVMLMGLAGLLAWQVERSPGGDASPVSAPKASVAPAAERDAAPVAPAPAANAAAAARVAAPTKQIEPAAPPAPPPARSTAPRAEPAAPRAAPRAARSTAAAESADKAAAPSATPGFDGAVRREAPQAPPASPAPSGEAFPATKSVSAPRPPEATATSRERVETRQALALDQRDAAGRTPLLRAIDADDVQAVQRLLDDGANPRLPDLEGATPLDHARRRGNTKVIELIEAAQVRVP